MSSLKQLIFVSLSMSITLMSCSATSAKPTEAIVGATSTPMPLAQATPTRVATLAPVVITSTSEPLPLLPALLLGPVTTTLQSPTKRYEAMLLNRVGDTSTSFLLTIDSAPRGNTWTVVNSKEKIAGGIVALVPMGWSPDDQYFYFTRMFAGTGCDAFLSGSELSQANVVTRKVRVFKYPTGGPMALSPDTKTLAQIVYEEIKPARKPRRKATPTPTPVADEAQGPQLVAKLVLRDIAGRRERSVVLAEGSDVNAFQAGGLAWKPDGSALMLAYAYDPCNAKARYSVVEMNVQTLKPRVILDRDARLFTPQVWAEGGWVELLDRQQKRWLMDPANGQVAIAG